MTRAIAILVCAYILTLAYLATRLLL